MTEILTIGFFSYFSLIRYLIVADHRHEAIERLSFEAWANGRDDAIERFESHGGFWLMFFDLRKWFFNQFYPGV